MILNVIGSVNDPGIPGKTGDDRIGADAAAGTAWVLDGATDVTDLRPFPACESGAAWIAQALCDRLGTGPAAREAPEAYFEAVLADVRHRAAGESRIPVDRLPGEALPIAAGMWMWLQDGRAVFAHMSDCMALVRSGPDIRMIGDMEKAEDESAAARRMLAMPLQERLDWLRQARRRSNELGTCFGIGPAGAASLRVEQIPIGPGDEVCLMSDGLFRLISPYATHTPDTFMHVLAERGLLALVRALRDFEESPAGDIPRLKRRDDASGIYVRIDA